MNAKEFCKKEDHECYSWAKEIARWFDYCADQIDEMNKEEYKFEITGYNEVYYSYKTHEIQLSCEYRNIDTGRKHSFNESWKVKSRYGYYKGFLAKIMYQYLKEGFEEHEDFKNSSIFFGTYDPR